MSGFVLMHVGFGLIRNERLLLVQNSSNFCHAVDDFGMIVNEKHVDRLENLIQTVARQLLAWGAIACESVGWVPKSWQKIAS